nr:hypothetical protein [Cellvibrio sp. pealriver]
MSFRLLPFAGFATAGFGAILYVIPDFLPFFSPYKWALAMLAGLLRKMLFFHIGSIQLLPNADLLA